MQLIQPLQPLLTDRYDRALLYARHLHHTQIRKGSQTNPHYPGLPYFSHLLSVSSLVLEHRGTETEAIAALLHDALEDGPHYSDRSEAQIRQEIATQFGLEVLTLVEACSQSTDPQREWYQRKQDYIDGLAHKPFSALLITTADKCHNARCISRDYGMVGEALWSRFSRGLEGTQWYYRTIAQVLHGLSQDEDLKAGDRRSPFQSLVGLLTQEVQGWTELSIAGRGTPWANN
ncbi:MAG: HD domain-containing protein [Prochlorothrix sp.]|nr:HD domain-containing protein [Prochlorothrix sp.]